MPDTPYTSCEPVMIMLAHPNTLFTRFMTIKTKWPTFSYRCRIISNDVCAYGTLILAMTPSAAINAIWKQSPDPHHCNNERIS